ncbi:MAG TPA: hypothetical protein VMH83_08720, partial [Candidatus Acidoferrum sp.]|nr:hypothetical protein [Candidatus Acidoferrum sp.]
MTVADVAIKPFSLSDLEALQAHFGRHRAESGLGGVYFMPFEVNGLDAPRGVVVEKAFIALDQPLWQRWFCAHDAATGRIVGHVDLKGDAL